MRTAIGFIIILWGLFYFMGQAMSDLEQALSASFKALESAAQKSEQRLSEI